MVKTRTIRHKDGRIELTRVLSPGSLDEWSSDDPLAYERSIVWLQDPEPLPFVRVRTVRTARSQRGPLHLAGGARVVGYSKLTEDAPPDPTSKAYVRRVFYLKEADLQDQTTPRQFPEGCIDPRSLGPGLAGEAPR